MSAPQNRQEEPENGGHKSTGAQMRKGSLSFGKIRAKGTGVQQNQNQLDYDTTVVLSLGYIHYGASMIASIISPRSPKF